MPKRTNKFQRLIYFIQHELSSEATVTESKMLSNTRTGSSVEVDIVIETETGGLSIVVGIECTTSSSRASTVEWVREMIGKHQDLPTNKLVLVSGSGFSQEAELVAKAHGVDTITFERAEEFDWSGLLADLVQSDGLKMARFDPVIDSWQLLFDQSELAKLNAVPSLNFDHNSIIHSSQGDPIGTVAELGIATLRNRSIIEQMMGRWIRDQETDYEITWNAPTGTTVSGFEGNHFKIAKLVIRGHVDVESTPLELSPAKYGATNIAYGSVPDIFSGKPGEATVFIAQREGEGEIGGMGFSSDSGFGKAVFPMQKPSTTYQE